MRQVIGWMAVLACGVLWVGTTWLPVRADAPPLKTVPLVDLERYMGRWYEIAAIPMFFERDCTANTTADYTLLPGGMVKVVNGCETVKRQRIFSEGRARVVDPKTNAKLKVTFLNVLGWRFIAGGDYWITALAPDYSHAIVGHPSRKYAWILARQPQLSKETLQALKSSLTLQGYDPCRLMIMPQAGGLQKRQSLCEVVQ
jgi:apolipoprotein D and lipocalin family protein